MGKLDLTGVTLGPTAAAVRSRVTPQQWRRIVNTAHQRGYAVDSFLDPNTPGPLKQRTPKFLRDQAMQTVATAYAPAYKEIDQREAKVNALSAKRAQDNQYYLNWLNSQHQALQAQAQAGDDALRTAATTITANTGAAYDQARTAAQQQLSQLPGTVSDFSRSNALGGVDAHKAAGVGQVGATANQALSSIDTGQQVRDLAGANNFASIAALEGKRTADQWSALQDLATSRLDLQTKQGQDAAKAINDAIQGEITKAQSNRDYAAVTQKLGLQQQDINSQIQNRRSSQRLNKAKLNETINYHQQLSQAKRDALNNSSQDAEANFEGKYGVSRKTFLGWDDKQRQQYLQRARQRGVLSGGKTGPNAFSPTQIRSNDTTYRSALSWARGHKPAPGELNDLVTALQAPKGQGETIHDPTTGSVVYNTDGTPKRKGGGGFALKDPMLAKAVALVAIYGGVDAKTRKQIEDAYGITLPLSKHVSFNPPTHRLYTQGK